MGVANIALYVISAVLLSYCAALYADFSVGTTIAMTGICVGQPFNPNLPCHLHLSQAVDVEYHRMVTRATAHSTKGRCFPVFASSSLEEIYHYVYYQVVSLATTMLDEVNGYTVDLFSNSVISAILSFFACLHGALACSVPGSPSWILRFLPFRRGGSFLGTGMNMLRLLIALLTFPPSGSALSVFDGYLRLGSHCRRRLHVGSSASISDLAKGAIDSMFSPCTALPSTQLTGGIWSFLKQAARRLPNDRRNRRSLQHERQLVGAHSTCRNRVGDLQNLFGNLKRGGDSAYTDLRRLPAHAFSCARLYGRFQRMVQAGGCYLLYSFCSEPALSARPHYAAGCRNHQPIFWVRPDACCGRSPAYCANVWNGYLNARQHRLRRTHHVVRIHVGKTIRTLRKEAFL